MLVTIVAVPNADNSGLDLDRLEKVEDLHPEIARDMLQHGTARVPSEDELAAYHDAQPQDDDEVPESGTAGAAEPDAETESGTADGEPAADAPVDAPAEAPADAPAQPQPTPARRGQRPTEPPPTPQGEPATT